MRNDRILHVIGWALIGFTLLYLGAHIIALGLSPEPQTAVYVERPAWVAGTCIVYEDGSAECEIPATPNLPDGGVIMGCPIEQALPCRD
jgi:hypothetical protein